MPSIVWVPEADVSVGDLVTLRYSLGYGTVYGTYMGSTERTHTLLMPEGHTHVFSQYLWGIVSIDARVHDALE